MSTTKPFRLSVIVVCWNVEKYLGTAVDSIVRQPLWEAGSVQLILLDNGSTDGTAELCESYADRYPDRVVFIRLDENTGVSAGRNRALEAAEGEYVTFLDADDYWTDGSLDALCGWLDANGAVDCAFGSLQYFEGRIRLFTSKELLSGDQIVDLTAKPQLTPLNVNNAVIRTNVARQVRFPEGQASFEDLAYITEVVSARSCYGMIPAARYMYRIRTDNTNASLNYVKDARYFDTDITAVLPAFLDRMAGEDGVTPAFAQHAVFYDLYRRLRDRNLPLLLGEEALATYKQRLASVLSRIDDAVIAARGDLDVELRMFALKLKYGAAFRDHLTCEGGALVFNGSRLYNLRKKRFLSVDILSISDGKLILEGRAGIPAADSNDYNIYLQDNDGNLYSCSNFSKYDISVEALGEEVLRKKGFRIEIPAVDGRRVRAYIEIDGTRTQVRIKYGKWGKFSEDISKSYYRKGNITAYQYDNALCIDTKRSRMYFELRLYKELYKLGFKDDIKLRMRTFRLRKSKRNRLWLFVDRVNSADENAEFLFRYVNSVKPAAIDTYYVLDEDSPDYERMKAYGKVIPYNSRDFLDKYLSVDEYITSQTTGFILFPTALEQCHCVMDLIPDHTLYLQHGVMEKDMSDSQNKLTNNLRMFVTSAPDEYRSMIEYPYGFTEREVVLTGLARHDQLLEYMDKSGKTVTIAPTWRHNLATRIDSEHGGRGYNPYFKESEFFAFYNGLISDPRILDKMREKGYRGIFRPHPYMRVQAVDFDLGDVFTLANEHIGYKEQFDDAGLLITDYSSIATDYAYTGCPVIYTQFDIDTFYENHTYKAGFFEYERDGFGPVCYDYESTVAEILKALDADCVMEDKYKARRDKFFAFSDGQNCERLYNEIVRISKED